MSKYKYHLHNYHAIDSADISIDGITVISGVNGSGKSTLSRWLYYLVNELAIYPYSVMDAFRKQLIHNIDIFLTVSREMFPGLSFFSPRKSLRDARMNIQVKKLNDIDDLEGLIDIYSNVLRVFEDNLSLYLAKVTQGARRERILSFLNIDSTDDLKADISMYSTKNAKLLQIQYKKIINNIEKRPKKIFFENIQRDFNVSEERPNNIQLKEDGVSLIKDDHISEFFNINRAIYIDTPMAISSNLEGDNTFWDSLRDLMITPISHPQTKEERSILIRLHNILNGTAKVTKTELGMTELRYVNSDNTVNIKLEDAATGFKTFAYIQMLLENGYLNDKTILIIDEPEAHLHPQWIVEFANILVELNKKLGVKIILASHNPDMVSAIKAISLKKGISDKTHFYLSELNVDTKKYQFKYLGQDIEPIFESFNIALERINSYGQIF